MVDVIASINRISNKNKIFCINTILIDFILIFSDIYILNFTNYFEK